MKIGIIGLPNVGKTTLFNALARTHAPAENYPFCTIDPNIGEVAVPDPRLDQLAAMVKPKRSVAAHVEFIDIAGLVKNAHQGEGLGNQFLSHIRDADALAHVIRCFTNENVAHLHGTQDPVKDAEIVDLELILADLQSVEKQMAKAARMAKGSTQASHERVLLEKIKTALEAGTPVRRFARTAALTQEERHLLPAVQALTAKPVMYIVNVGDKIDEQTRTSVAALRTYAANDGEVLSIAAEMEAELADLTAEERKQFAAELGMEVHGLADAVHSAYRLLDFVTFFTIVSDETHAWAIKRGTLIPQAAGKIHSDMEKGFIRADVVSFPDIVRTGSFAAARDAGVLKSEGRNYVVRDGDVIYIHFQQ